MIVPDPSAADIAGSPRLLRLLAEISSNFVVLHADQMDAAIVDTQRHIVESLDLDRSTLWQMSDDRAGMNLTHCWEKPAWPPLPRHLDAARHLPWSHDIVLKGEPFRFSRIEDLPPEAARDAGNFRAIGLKSNLTIPLLEHGRVFGALAFGTSAVERNWTREEIDGLELISRIMGNVLGRQRAEQRAEQLRRELTRRSRASILGELAAALAHEINQPLTSILGNAQAARRFIADGEIDSAETLAILDDIIRDNKRASEVIRNLRALLEGSSTAREVCGLNEIVAEVCGFLEAGLFRENIRLFRQAASGIPWVRVARVEIQEVLLNLIANATQAMADTPPKRRIVLIETSVSADQALVQVTDHGCGLSPGQIDRLFEPFHSTKPDGLGMGLAICRRVVTAHGGSIRARNHDLGGAEFTFSLPLAGGAG